MGRRKTKGGGKHNNDEQQQASTEESQVSSVNVHKKTLARGKKRTQEKNQYGPLPWSNFITTAVLTIIAYIPVFSAGFVWDDEIVREEPYLLAADGLFGIWFNPRAMKNEVHYWPIVYSFFWLEHRLWGINPLGFHVNNLILHVANSCLIQRLLQRTMSNSAAWLASIIFALHPVHVESVAWVIERKDVLSGIFYLAALLYHPSIDNHSGEKSFTSTNDSTRRMLIALVFYILGMLSKSITVSLPVILLLVPWMLRGRVTSTEIQNSVPFFVVGILIAAFDVSMAHDRESISFDLSFLDRVLIASRAVCFYALELVYPATLMPIYPLWDLHKDHAIWVFCVVACPTTFFTLVALRYRIGRGPLAALLFFVLTLAPVLCFIDYGYMRFSYVADRYQYLAGIGPIAVFAAFCTQLFTRQNRQTQPIMKSAVAILVVLLGSLTRRQVETYRDQETFFLNVVRLNPQAWSGWTNLGNEYLRQERDSEAVESYEQIFYNNTEETKYLTNYGIVLSNVGKAEESIDILKRAVNAKPGDTKALNALGNSLSAIKNHEEASAFYRRALEIDADYVTGWYNLGNELTRLARYNEAIEAFEQAVALSSTHIKARRMLANVLIALKRHSDAIEHLREALIQDPNNADVKKQLDEALAASTSS